MGRFVVTDTPLPGLHCVERRAIGDARGSFVRLFCADELREVGWSRSVVQVNHTRTTGAGTVRGLHYQHPPHAETKLVSCLRGEVWDVAVDLRQGSPTFLRWHAERLSAANGRALLIPRGFAHGFQCLSDEVEMLYCHDAALATSAEGGVHPLDARLALPWPLQVRGLSARDAAHPPIDAGYPGVAA